MKLKHIIPLSFWVVPMGLLQVCPASEAQQASAPQASATTAEQDQLATDAQLITGRLENGLSYIIRPTKEPAGRGSVRLFVGVGSLHEEPHNSGISHFLEHMVFNGSRTFKRGELIPTMQKLGLGFGGDANAYTSLLHTVYMLDLPSLDEKTVDFALTIMRDFADGATLEADAIDHERGIVVSELKSRDSANYRAMISMLGQLTAGTRVAQYMPIGREEVIREAPYDVVRDYYKDHYVPERMTLIITGDFTPETAREWIEKHFATMQARPAKPAPALGELNLEPGGERLIPNPESADCSIMAMEVKPYVERPDTFAQRQKDFPLDLAMVMLNRRLSRMTQQPDCPFTAASVSQDEVFHASETIGLSLTAKPEDWDKALAAVVLQLRQAAQYGFSEQEVVEAIENIRAHMQRSCDTWETVTAKDMATRLVKAISDNTAFTDPAENYRVTQIFAGKLLADYREGHDAARNALAAAFDASKARLTMTGSLPEGVSEAALRAVYDQALQAEVPKPAAEKALTFAYDTIGMPGVVLRREQPDALGVTKVTLSNGVKVNLKPIDFRKGSISVTAAVDGGAMSLPDAPGLGVMLSAVMQRGGLKEHSIDELDRVLAGKQVGLNFELEQTRFLFKGNTNATDLELQCKLLAAAIMHPGFRPEGELQLRRKLDSQYRQLTTTPDGAMAMQLRRALFGENPRFVIPTQAEVESHNTQNVQALMADPLRTNALEVSLVGDFNVDDVLPVLERTFGAMPQRRDEFTRIPDQLRRAEFRPWGQRTFLRYPTQLDKTIVAIVHPAGNGRDDHRNRRLQLLASIVRAKLFDGLRAVMGESYSPRVQVVTNSEYDDAAYIVAISAGVKGNRTRVSAAIDTICYAIGRGEISQEDFECAINPLITSAQKMLVTPGFWEAHLEQYQSDPKQAGLIQDLLEDIRSITLEEIQALAREVYGKDEDRSFFFVVPEDYDENESADSAEAPAPPTADLSSLNSPAPGEYVVITTRATYDQAEWKKVADTLSQKYEGASVCTIDSIDPAIIAQHLRTKGARYAAFVLRPEEISREVVNYIHRATREVDDDPYGDCIWGIVTGYSAADAQRIAETKEPLVIQRVLSTTNVDSARFEQSYCITDWEGFPILSQKGYTKPTKTTFTMDTPEGQDAIENGVQGKFSHHLATQAPQFIVTSSHATPFNLEMPFSKGLIFSANNRFYQMGCKQLATFVSALQPAMAGKTGALQSLAEAMQFPTVEPDGTPRVWLASGNCLIGDARQTQQSMVITALSAYTCNQFVGYTVPSWFGEAGWGTLGTFMGNTDNTTLAEAFFLNNQFIIQKTLSLDPRLLTVHFNEPELGPALQRDLIRAGIDLKSNRARDAVGLVHDRDTLAFYGDPGWAALVDHSHAHAPLKIDWQDDTTCTLTANSDYTGRAAIWFPRAAIGRNANGCDLPGAVFTNDFILIPSISLKSGESITIHLNISAPEAH